MSRLIAPMTLAALCLCGAIALPSSAEAQAASPVESITGHAEFVLTPPGIRFSYSVNAVRHKDGTVSGEFENHVDNVTTGEFILRAHVAIVCFTINGNVARIGGIIERQVGGPPLPEDRNGYITVVDNGEGTDDPADLASVPAFGSAAAHCDTGLPVSLLPIEHGNIQVRSSGF
jgi:hypothetical protein